MAHPTIDLYAFAENLREELNKRIGKFVMHTQGTLKNKSNLNESKSKREWMAEYKKWMANTDIEKIILDYLADEKVKL